MNIKFAKINENNIVIDIQEKRINNDYHPVSYQVRIGWYYDNLDKGFHPPVAPDGYEYDWYSGGFSLIDETKKEITEKEKQDIRKVELSVAEKYIDELVIELIDKGVI